MSLKASALAIAALALAACGKPPAPPPSQDCSALSFTRATNLAANHVATCSESCGNGANPPSGGPHCGSTLACRVYDSAQESCRWLHNLEHGHLVLAYSCPAGCPEVVGALTAYWQERPSPRRMMLIPIAGMPRRVAAILWGETLLMDDVDTAGLDCLRARQDVSAPEPGLGCPQ